MRVPADAGARRSTGDRVPRTAQRLLTAHLRADDPVAYWPGIRLDRSGARLTGFDASGCTLTDADFTGTEFRWTVFRRDAVFEGARFAGAANFGRAQFHGPARFDGATLHRRPEVDQARASTAYPHSWPPGVSTSALDDDWLTLTAG